MREYWAAHQELRARTDLARDPHALGNVCMPEAPEWLNRHYARGQEATFERLLALVDGPPRRALDVGCGAARWSERLHARGWSVTGIDLQQALIDHNRVRLPDLSFECIALQDLQPEQPFDLVCSVTVLGHVPHDEQPRALDRLRMITAPGGHVLLLENLRDQAAHVFANSLAEWTDMMREHSFRRLAVAPYGYDPALRALAGTRRLAGSLAARRRGSSAPVDHDGASRQVARGDALAVRAYGGALSLAGMADRRLDPWLTRREAHIPPPVHAGMLFVRH